ncbi:hypothetical protein AciX9_4479 (plasmid) [Granulicella tundricola MP5ACTX9]|uniref:3-keto-disaccharide hydrolase domain-containing protein n=2 Tax=Granulicella TaxID=940557 RepID=E8X7J1_GRATM|nr:hypothetical protein AciX9_4479 [Granulicella tundricola MP5ACTX9]
MSRPRASLHFTLFSFITLCLSLPASVSGARRDAKAGQVISMTANYWHPVGEKADVQYVMKEGFPDGMIVLKSGDVALNDLSFRDGTLEFDMKPLAQDIPGMRFRQRDSKNGEEFYIRSFPDCRAEDDCIQYSPVISGFMLWNVYPQYQRRAPVVFNGWNHIRLVISGKRMNVFINDSVQPTLAVGELLGNTQQGGLELHGPAAFANLVVTPGKTDGLSPVPLPDSTGSDMNIVHDWLLGPLTSLRYGSTPRYAESPQDPRAWKPIRSERFGIVNLNRQFNASNEAAALSWLKTSVDSDRDQQQQVSLGWIGHAWVFVNGSLITSGKNFYYPESERRSPDGRLSLQNGSFMIPLHRGHNEIMIALYSSVHDDARSRTAYGWGFAMRYEDMRGLAVPR